MYRRGLLLILSSGFPKTCSFKILLAVPRFLLFIQSPKRNTRQTKTYFTMRKITFILLPLIAVGLLSCKKNDDSTETINFTSSEFKKFVLIKYDANKDLELSIEEASAIKILNLSERHLGSVNGIEYFTNLTELDVFENYLTELDVSKNTKLIYLNCESNPDLPILTMKKGQHISNIEKDDHTEIVRIN